MKRFKKLSALFLALVLVLGLCVSAGAEHSDGNGNASITIQNAAKGETYKVYKLFEAIVTGDQDGSIAYVGTIPEKVDGDDGYDLTQYFTYVTTDDGKTVLTDADDCSYVKETSAARDGDAMSAGLETALKNWVAKQTTETGKGTGDGGALSITGLAYGYYVVTTSQGAQTIMVTSTNPQVTIYDKSSTSPSSGEKGTKTVNDSDVSIGDTINYTIDFKTANYEGSDASALMITSYTITDSLPAFLTNVTVTKITIGGVEYKENGATPQFDENKTITIPWAENNKSIYDNGAEVVITYTAEVTDKIAVGGESRKNKNEVIINWTLSDKSTSTTTVPGSVEISTYAAAIQKTDASGNNLPGATFSIAGLIVEGSNGVYTVKSYDPASTAEPTVMEADDDGLIVIMGIASDETLVATEVKAPDGYNRLTAPVNVSPVKTDTTITTTTVTTTYDAAGTVISNDDTTTAVATTKTTIYTLEAVRDGALHVQNATGSTLPTTGGMGTTIFYVVGGILVVGAAILLITKKRMNMEE